MASFVVKARKKGPVTIVTVDAESRDDAIAKTVATAAEGEEIEVMDAKEADGASPPTGATGTTATARHR